MGQSISGERFFSALPRPSGASCERCDSNASTPKTSFGCFKIRSSSPAVKESVSSEFIADLPVCTCGKTEPKNQLTEAEQFKRDDSIREGNYSRIKRLDMPRSTDEVVSSENSDKNNMEQSLNGNADNLATNSIDRYISAFSRSVERLSIEEERSDSTAAKKISKFRDLKRSKNKSNGECSGCFKDKQTGKVVSKKKNPWSMRIYSSKLSKGNNGRVSLNNAGSSANETESGCVCTSYRKVDYNENRENDDRSGPSEVVARAPQQLSLGWASELAAINRNRLKTQSQRTSGIYAQRSTECLSCEGSHRYSDVGFSNINGLPLNFAVAQFGSNSGPNSSENNVIFLSLAQNNQVFDMSRINSDDRLPEDCEERARVLRALEIAEGVEPPPGYSPHIQVVSPSELRALLFQQQSASLCTHQIQPYGRVHTQVDYIHCLVPDLRSITSCSFYWGKIDRYEAERLLEGKEEGTFLLRDSAQEEYLFSVSFRKYQRSLHARIEQFNHKFSFDSHDPGVFASDTVTGLIEHYKDPSCVMFFEPMLTVPLSRTFTFPLQHLCRAVIVSCTTYDGINKLRLPNKIKAYLKEYHYQQRVRVKRFDDTLGVIDETD